MLIDDMKYRYVFGHEKLITREHLYELHKWVYTSRIWSINVLTQLHGDLWYMYTDEPLTQLMIDNLFEQTGITIHKKEEVL